MFRKGLVCFVSASVRFWLDHFLFLAAAEGWIYFAHVAVRKFTKTTTIWVQIIHSFTYFISSDKHFLWSIFWSKTRSGFFHVACGVPNISWLVRPHWYFRPTCWERGIGIHCVWWQGSAGIKQRHALSQTSKQLVVQPFTCESPAYALTWLAGRWTESLKLQTWGSLMVKTWSQYLQYFFWISLRKLLSSSTPSRQLAWEAAEY